MATANANPAQAAAPKRVKSKATVLKLRLGAIKREIVSLDKDIKVFNDMKASHDKKVQARAKLDDDLAKVKQDLIKEMGLD